jgi:Xaa-Pro dipeptidase
MYVPSGPYSSLAHATWTERRLERGDVVFFELPTSYKRYSGFVMRTAVIGPSSDKTRLMADATIAGLEAAIEAIKPGVTAGEVDAANRRVIKRAGFGALHRHRTGYSLGIAYPPGSREGHIMDLKQGDSRELQTGMVFHVVPLVQEQGVAGVGVDETVLVTENGREVLGDFPRQLIQC